jgi:hypothetical protein
LVAAIVAMSCRSSTPDPTFRTEWRAVSEWVKPPDASIVSTRDEVRSGMKTTKVRELSVPLTWGVYQDHLRQSAGSGYHERETSDAREVFSRLTDGDMFVLNVDLLSSGPALRVRVRLTGMPD